MSHDRSRFNSISFEQAVEDLKDDSFMNGELGYDVSKEEMSMVLCCWIHTRLDQETRPSERHKTPKFVPMTLVPRIMDVWRCLIHQETGELSRIIS